MRNIALVVLVLASTLILSGCNWSEKGERDDAIRLEGMMPKEDNETVNAMIKKTDENKQAAQ